MHSSLSPIFVGGTGRSGTTAVLRVLATDTTVVAAVPELRVHVDPNGALDLLNAMTDNWSPYQADNAVHEFENLMVACRRSNRLLSGIARVQGRISNISPWRYAGLSLGSHFGFSTYDSKLAKLISDITTGTAKGFWAGTRSFSVRPIIFETTPLERVRAATLIGAFFNDLYESIRRHNHRYWAESTPYSILHADKLLELFPMAKFIHVVRHPPDVVASYLTMHWGGSDAISVANRLLRVYRRWWMIREKIPKDRFLEVQLEDLANPSTKSWEKIANFLDNFDDHFFEKNLIKPEALHRNRSLKDLSAQKRRDVQAILDSAILEYEYR